MPYILLQVLYEQLPCARHCDNMLENRHGFNIFSFHQHFKIYLDKFIEMKKPDSDVLTKQVKLRRKREHVSKL